MLRKKDTKKVSSKKQNNKKINFKLRAQEAHCVLLAGDFNSWDPNTHPLKRTSNGLWKISINLSPGRYEYRFLVDGQWQNDPNCSIFVPNTFGSENCVVTLE